MAAVTTDAPVWGDWKSASIEMAHIHLQHQDPRTALARSSLGLGLAIVVSGEINGDRAAAIAAADTEDHR